MVLDNHILPVWTVESFQHGFPQAVENSCGFAESMRFFRIFSAIFSCFLPKIAVYA